MMIPALINFEDFLQKFLLIGALLCVSSCIGADDPYLYDKTGFDVGATPQNARDPISPTRVAPDYYYRQPAYPTQPYAAAELQPQGQQNYIVPQQQYQQQQQPTPYYAPQSSVAPYQQQQAVYQAQPAAQPYYAAPASQQADPGSRFYSNPYAIPPTNQPTTRYDADQFYVPPVYRNNIEPQPVQDRSAKY